MKFSPFHPVAAQCFIELFGKSIDVPKSQGCSLLKEPCRSVMSVFCSLDPTCASQAWHSHGLVPMGDKQIVTVCITLAAYMVIR